MVESATHKRKSSKQELGASDGPVPTGSERLVKATEIDCKSQALKSASTPRWYSQVRIGSAVLWSPPRQNGASDDQHLTSNSGSQDRRGITDV